MTYAGIPCFWAEPTELARHALRRYSRIDGGCTVEERDWHNASVDLPGEHAIVSNEPGTYRGDFPADRDDPRWPTHCECGYEFTPVDHWQGNVTRLYRRGDTGELVPLNVPWMLTHLDWHPFGPWEDRYGDGINLTAICPNGAHWAVDGPAYGDGESTPNAWTRQGNPRDPGTLTVTPSIIAGDYHGWLGVNGAEPGHFSAG